jgi:hypothetical protein
MAGMSKLFLAINNDETACQIGGPSIASPMYRTTNAYADVFSASFD